MKSKVFRKCLSVICVVAMAVTSLTGYQTADVSADMTTVVYQTSTEGRADLLSEISNEDFNFALNKDATVSRLTTVDGGEDLSIITNGKFDTGNSKTTIVEIGRSVKEDRWVQVDLGAAYDTEKIDRVAVMYKTLNSGPTTESTGSYSVQFSLNGMDYVDIGEASGMAGGTNAIYLDKITMTEEQKEAIPYARYIRVYATRDLSSYGMQVKGMAVLTDGFTKVSEVEQKEVETLDDPVSLVVTSSDYDQLEYSFQAALGDEGDYTYYAYVDGRISEEAVVPGNTYVVTGLSGGTHTVKIVAAKDGVYSEGITETVNVTDTKSLLTSDRNFAIGKAAKASSIRENDLETNITDGNITTLFRTATTDTQSAIVIDLGDYYRLDAIERVVALYADGRYPKNYTVDYSLNGTDYETVAVAEGNQELQSAETDSSACTFPAVRYVRFSLSNPVAANYGFQMYELGVIVEEDADMTPVEVTSVNNPADFVVEVTGYNTVKATITAGENQEGYKYNIYIDDEVVLKEVKAGTYELKDIPSGNKTFTVKSVYEGVTSDGISVTREVEDAFAYTYETLANSSTEAGKVLETEKTEGENTYYNYALYKKTTASALSEENAVYTADKAIDGDSTTRWASVQGTDPQWYLVDLGRVYKIHELDIVWQNASAKDFDIEVSQDGDEYIKIGSVKEAATGSRYDNIRLTEETTARYVRIVGTARTGIYGYSIWEMGIYGPEQATYYTVSVDGVEEKIEDGSLYVLPEEAQYGYFCDGKMYAPGTEVIVEGDMMFTPVNELSVTMADGAGIRYIGTAGIRFQSTILSDNMDAVASDAITEGTLITAGDIYEAKGEELTLTSDYTKLDVANSGWYQDTVGTYCGSICDVVESNYIRNFTARAYVTINYENGDAVTVYSSMGPVRSISQVASAVKNAGYAGIGDEYKSTIDSFIK